MQRIRREGAGVVLVDLGEGRDQCLSVAVFHREGVGLELVTARHPGHQWPQRQQEDGKGQEEEQQRHTGWRLGLQRADGDA